MKTAKSVNFEIGLLEKLDAYLYANKIKSRSAFICDAINEKLDGDISENDNPYLDDFINKYYHK